MGGRRRKGQEGIQRRKPKNIPVIPLTSLLSSSVSKWKKISSEKAKAEEHFQVEVFGSNPRKNCRGPDSAMRRTPSAWVEKSLRSPKAKQDGKHFSGFSSRSYSQASLLLLLHRREKTRGPH